MARCEDHASFGPKSSSKTKYPAYLTVIWCDRCGRIVNQNDERDHFHAEQCGCCRKYKKIDAD